MSKTIFVDIDGTIIFHVGSLSNILDQCSERINYDTYNYYGELLPMVREKFNEWAYKGYKIIITTARPESMREFTKRQLQYHSLFWDDIIFGLPRGPRVVLNDSKPAADGYEELITAVAVPLKRNEGLGNVDV